MALQYNFKNYVADIVRLKIFQNNKYGVTEEFGNHSQKVELGQQHVQFINRIYKRSVTLWEGRFRSSVIEQEIYLLVCQQHIELNPVRAEMVDHPGQYRWSSYRINGQGERCGQINVVCPIFFAGIAIVSGAGPTI